MNIYRRYFKVTSGPIIDAVKKAEEINDTAHDAYKKIIEEIGALPGYYHIDRKLVGFQFKDKPDSGLFKKRSCGGWYPKKNCKAGKKLADRLESVKTIPPSDALKVIGLSSHPTIFGGGKCYAPTIIDIPENPPVIYISVPWYDEDPEKLKQYKKDRKDGKGFDSNLDSIQWKPSPEMEEVKEWQVSKHIDEYNESVKNGGK